METAFKSRCPYMSVWVLTLPESGPAQASRVRCFSTLLVLSSDLKNVCRANKACSPIAVKPWTSWAGFRVEPSEGSLILAGAPLLSSPEESFRGVCAKQEMCFVLKQRKSQAPQENLPPLLDVKSALCRNLWEIVLVQPFLKERNYFQ